MKIQESPIDPSENAGQAGDTTPETLLEAVKAVLEDRQAEDIVVINLAGKSSIADYMVIASGRSSRQVMALAENVIETVKRMGVKGMRPEGMGQGDWVLIDAKDVIIHIFRPEVREFYNLEKMWDAALPESDRSTGAGA